MRQLEELGEHRCVRFAGPDDWLGEAEGSPLLVFSNELLDAFPVHRIERKDGKLLEWYVGWDESGSCFRTVLLPLDPNGAAAAYMQRERITIREGQWIEANPAASDWIGRMGAAIEQGALITIDYGDVAEELYAAHRMRGTFLCYRNHQASDDPYACPGEQDMTSHVNFTACLRAGREAGFAADSLRTQKQFLLDEGVLELLVAHSGTDPFGPEARRNRAVRQLLLGDSMNELFKVLVQTK
jgi:SAM-dependent MidA family methyltransferase